MGGRFQCFYGFQYERRSDYGLDLKYGCIRADCDGAMTLRSSKDFVLSRPHNHSRIEIEDPESATAFIVVEGVNKRFVKVFERTLLIIREGKCEIGGECEIAVRKHEKSKAVVRGIFRERGDAVLMMISICEENGIDLCAMDAEAKAKLGSSAEVKAKLKPRPKTHDLDSKGTTPYPLYHTEKPDCSRFREEDDGELLNDETIEEILAETESTQRIRSCCFSENCMMQAIISQLNQNNSELAVLRGKKKLMWNQLSRINRKIDQFFISPQPVVNNFQPKFNFVPREVVDQIAANNRNPFEFAKKLWPRLYKTFAERIAKVRWRNPAKILELQCLIQAYYPSQNDYVAVKRWQRIWKALMGEAMTLRRNLLNSFVENANGTPKSAEGVEERVEANMIRNEDMFDVEGGELQETENQYDQEEQDDEEEEEFNEEDTVDPDLMNAPDIPSMESLVGNFSDYLKALLQKQQSEEVEDSVAPCDIKKEIKEEAEE